MHSAIGLIELGSIARGLTTADAMVKKAPVEIVLAKTVSPGKYIILIAGDVASVDESVKAGIQTAGDYLVDSLFIPQIHGQILPSIKNKFQNVLLNAIAIVETQSVASTIVALDGALKTARTDLIRLKLGQGLGGKGYFVLTGELSEIEAAVAHAKNSLKERDKLLQAEIIASPHAELWEGVAL